MATKSARKTEPIKKSAMKIIKKKVVIKKKVTKKPAFTFKATKLKLRRPVPSDIEIAQEAKIKPILQVAKELGIRENELELYGPYKAKVKLEILERLKNKPNGKYIDVNSLSHTETNYHTYSHIYPAPNAYAHTNKHIHSNAE